MQAQQEHVPAVVDLWKKLNDYQAGFDLSHRIKDDAHIGFTQYVKDKLLSEENLFLVAIIHDEVVGFSISAVTTGRPDVYAKPPFVEISDMFVLKEHRRQSVGEAMLNHIRRWAKAKGILRIELNAEARNTIGLTFWHKHGFTDFLSRLYIEI